MLLSSVCRAAANVATGERASLTPYILLAAAVVLITAFILLTYYTKHKK